MAVANYAIANGKFPPAVVRGPDGRPWHSWRVLILPYVEQQELYQAYDFAEPRDGPNNRKLAARMPRMFAFHGTRRPGDTVTNYLAVVGPETVWADAARPVAEGDVPDGPGQTVLIVENLGADVHWMEPRDVTLADMDLRLGGPGGVSSPYDDPAVVAVDTTVYRLRPDIRPEVLRALLTARGGEPLAEDGRGGWEFLADGRRRARREP